MGWLKFKNIMKIYAFEYSTQEEELRVEVEAKTLNEAMIKFAKTYDNVNMIHGIEEVVKAEKPEKRIRILCCSEIDSVKLCYWSEEDNAFINRTGLIYHNVTHWMNLPPKPTTK